MILTKAFPLLMLMLILVSMVFAIPKLFGKEEDPHFSPLSGRGFQETVFKKSSSIYPTDNIIPSPTPPKKQLQPLRTTGVGQEEDDRETVTSKLRSKFNSKRMTYLGGASGCPTGQFPHPATMACVNFGRRGRG